ncbi:hypothetical protein L6164_015680 [Bauhinia variegata]|uniref:Uncharacterized protein n=1 Tax=Bauhinia variegata TaxID=167791 RepID=A0ACB9NLX6_BAUVA|nr:hypothetical protein L6164_015680 [Bauhinia variegata]
MESGAVPKSATDSVNRTLANVEELQNHMQEFLALFKPEVLAQMPPLERAQSQLMFAKITSTLFTLKLRCTGVNPDGHRVKSELERLSLYQDKMERLVDLSKAPLRPSTTLNSQAATRVIEHSLPDLTPEQRRHLRDISRGEGQKMDYEERSGQKKRKYRTSEKQSVQMAAKEFLEKAARELLGNSSDDIKGPVQIDVSDDE